MAKKKTAVSKKKRSKRKGGGSKLARTEIVQVRLDPKLRFSAEIASKVHRRTLSSFIEWAVDQAVKDVVISKEGESAEDIANKVWALNEADRFVGLASWHSELLSYDEECLWKLIIDKQLIWDNTFSKNKVYVGNIYFKNFPILRYLFSDFKEQINNPSPHFDGLLEKRCTKFEHLQDESL